MMQKLRVNRLPMWKRHYCLAGRLRQPGAGREEFGARRSPFAVSVHRSPFTAQQASFVLEATLLRDELEAEDGIQNTEVRSQDSSHRFRRLAEMPGGSDAPRSPNSKLQTPNSKPQTPNSATYGNVGMNGPFGLEEMCRRHRKKKKIEPNAPARANRKSRIALGMLSSL